LNKKLELLGLIFCRERTGLGIFALDVFDNVTYNNMGRIFKTQTGFRNEKERLKFLTSGNRAIFDWNKYDE